MSEAEKIASGLSPDQREALLAARWLHPGGQEPICLIPFVDGMPKDVARLFTLTTSRLTPLGLAVRAALEHQSREAI